MVAPGKRRRPVVSERTLPEDLLLEIVARSEPGTLVRCAAACRTLRREILDPSFLRRVCSTNEDGGAGIIPPRVLAFLHNKKQDPPLVSLVHPATPAASSFTDGCLAPYVLRRAIDIRGSCDPMNSRGGLVVLPRQHDIDMTPQRYWYDLCVFNPMTGDRTYLPCLSGFYPNQFVLLTAADGIGCSFMLLATNVDRCNRSGGFRITVQGTVPGGTSWGPITQDVYSLLPYKPLQHQSEPVVLHGGIVHWLLSDGDQVLTYNVGTKRLGTVKVPPTSYAGCRQLLGMSPDGRRLRLFDRERFMIFMWVHRSDGWAKEVVIDVEHKLQSLLNFNVSLGLMWIEFKCCAEMSGVVLLQAYLNNRLAHQGSLILLDLETKEMRMINSPHTSSLFEVDLSARLQAMKIY